MEPHELKAGLMKAFKEMDMDQSSSAQIWGFGAFGVIGFRVEGADLGGGAFGCFWRLRV